MRGVKFGVQVQRHQFFAAGVAQHAHEGVVAIQQFAFGGGDENAFLHLLEEQPVFFLRDAAVGGVAHYVDRALLLAALLDYRTKSKPWRSRRNTGSGPSWNPSSRDVRSTGIRSTVRFVRQHRFARVGRRRPRAPVQALQQGMIGLHHAEFRVVQQHQVLDGIEGVRPLPMGAQNLFHQAQVFDRQSQLVGGGDQKLHFVGRVGEAVTAAQGQCPDHRLLAQHRHHHDVVKSFLLQIGTDSVGRGRSLNHHRHAFGELRSKISSDGTDRRSRTKSWRKADLLWQCTIRRLPAGGTRRPWRASGLSVLRARWP